MKVNYDDESWLMIAQALADDPSVFPDNNRAAIISDSAELCFYGVVDVEICFQLPKFLSSEASFIVWSSASRNFHKLLGAMTKAGMAKTMVYYYINPLFIRITYELTSDKKKLNNFMLLSHIGRAINVTRINIRNGKTLPHDGHIIWVKLTESLIFFKRYGDI